MATITEGSELLDSGFDTSEMLSPEIKSFTPDDDDNYDESEEDESLVERLIGLTEMFPEEVRNFGYNTGVCMKYCIKGLYSISRTVTWLFISSSVILLAPVLLETERAKMEEAQRNHQKQVLLGPSSAMSSSGSNSLMMVPPIQR